MSHPPSSVQGIGPTRVRLVVKRAPMETMETAESAEALRKNGVKYAAIVKG